MAEQITEQTLQAEMQAYHAQLARDPDNLQAILGLGILAGHLQQWDTAIAWFARAITLAPQDLNSHTLLAKAYLNQGTLDRALQHYQTALMINADIFTIHYDLALLYQKQQDYSLALHHYKKALPLQPDSYAAHFSLGLLFLKQNEYQSAAIQFTNVLKLYPKYVPALVKLGHCYLQLKQLDNAQDCYQQAINLQPKQIEALNNLGAILLQKQQYVAAMRLFAQILQIDEQHLEARSNLAASLLHQDRYLEAIRHYQEYLSKCDDSDAHYNLGVALMSIGELEQAKEHFSLALHSTAYQAASHINLGAIYLKQRAHEQAIHHYRAAQQLQPNNPSVNYLLHALNRDNLPAAAPTSYIRDLFDNYAGNYDVHMLQTLYYQTPGLLKNEIKPLLNNASPFWHILDLGCGTGLAGSVFRDWAQTLIGIDISPKMLITAQQKHLYDQLIEADFISGLHAFKQEIDLIIAADAWLYQGDLDPLYAACLQSLKSKGILAFSTEISDAKDYELQSSGRYAHNLAYLKRLALKYGYQWLHAVKAIARQQEYEPVWIYLIVLSKP